MKTYSAYSSGNASGPRQTAMRRTGEELWHSYAFYRKKAFEKPYQATKIYDLTELLDMLSQRSEYFGEEEEPGPFVYINGEYIGELKPHENNAFAVRE